MSKITEIIPDDRPDWFDEHMEKGDLFRYVIERVEELNMDIEVKEIFDDIRNNFFASDDTAYEKIKGELKSGMRINWYYKEDQEFAEEHEFSIKDDPGFSGIVIPIPGVTMQSTDQELDTDNCIVVVTKYPAEKEYCRCGWIYMERLLDQENLVEIYPSEQMKDK